MLTTRAPKSISGSWANGDTKSLPKRTLRNDSCVNFLIDSFTHCSLHVASKQALQKSLPGSSSFGCSLSRKPNIQTFTQLVCCASSDDEYRSSRNIAISLFRRYRSAVDRGGAENLKEFIRAGVNAYALGCTDEGLRKELLSMKSSELELEENHVNGGRTNLKLKICSEEVNECILWLSIIFITILCTPQPTIVRWSSTLPVSTEIMLQWKGFCALIANAYYMKGMAWLPVKTLQLEQMAVMGSAEEPSVVAGRMQLVFSTLENVSPQWPRV